MKRYIVVEVGCIECGVSTQIAGVYKTRKQAEAHAKILPTWRDGGQSYPEVFEIIINK